VREKSCCDFSLLLGEGGRSWLGLPAACRLPALPCLAWLSFLHSCLSFIPYPFKTMTDLCAAAALCNIFWGYACEVVVDRWGCERENCEGEAS